eukprot:TRINITY_DN2002_c0_g1_i1.p1 TRINITY_DN2002_c0_g1~~TRINITY_DN2002_c0_g1_i1.p1  ORF type:complete len:101 (-),score=3.16 TRINITY_DN2002_c0_g1_i1:613-915(-)
MRYAQNLFRSSRHLSARKQWKESYNFSSSSTDTSKIVFSSMMGNLQAVVGVVAVGADLMRLSAELMLPLLCCNRCSRLAQTHILAGTASPITTHKCLTFQ